MSESGEGHDIVIKGDEVYSLLKEYTVEAIYLDRRRLGVSAGFLSTAYVAAFEKCVSAKYIIRLIERLMHRDRVVGAGLVVVGVVGILLYGWLVFFSPWQTFILQLTAFVAVAAVLGILAWVGYTLATTPPPKPIEEIEREVQKALEEVEKQSKEPQTSS
jgi:predicted DNA-binding transcriptional regulator